MNASSFLQVNAFYIVITNIYLSCFIDIVCLYMIVVEVFLPLRMGFSRLMTAIGKQQTRLKIQIATIIL